MITACLVFDFSAPHQRTQFDGSNKYAPARVPAGATTINTFVNMNNAIRSSPGYTGVYRRTSFGKSKCDLLPRLASRSRRARIFPLSDTHGCCVLARGK